jgi:phosphotriesterase-related protein
VDKGTLSEIDGKIVRAAAVAHRETGLTIAAHTGANPEAVTQQLAILKEEGVDPAAWIWVHAHEAAVEDLLAAADAGAWIELDAIRPGGYGAQLMRVEALVQAGHLSQVLLSHDGNSHRLSGRAPKPYDALFTSFIPILEKAGFDRESAVTLTERNPARAFTVGVRTR